MPGSTCFLWLDFRRDISTPGLFQTVPLCYRAYHRVPPCDTLRLVQTLEPRLLCFEFDFPQPPALAALLQIRLQRPNLPLVMATESHSESLALWAFRAGVLDYLVKPLTAEELNTRLEWLVHACLALSDCKGRPPASDPLPPCTSWQPPQPLPPKSKTLAACQFVGIHFAEKVRLAQVADACHMCISEFSRAFKKENGQTFSEYLVRYRITQACALLSSDPAASVKAVAFRVGFNDVSYFARTFRRFNGATPSTYRFTAHGEGRPSVDLTGG